MTDGVYNEILNSHVNIDKSTRTQLATQTEPGLMSKEDLCKLLSIVVPPPSISLSSEQCGTRIRSGVISIISGDQYVKVDNYVGIKQNEDGTSPATYESVPIKISEDTYGIRFSLNIDRLSFYLERNGRLKLKGRTGEIGDPGNQGPPGEDFIISGPRGDKGSTGNTPISGYTLSSETIETVNVGNTGITKIRHQLRQDGCYDLIVTRQPIGSPNVSTNKFRLGGNKSQWVVVIDGPGANKTPYYLDLGPIVTEIHNRATEYAETIRSGYEDAVKFWVKTMSDLFDSQKSTLCCALERCESKKKSNEVRRHLESVSASAKPDFKTIVKFKEEGAEMVESTGILKELYEEPCDDRTSKQSAHIQSVQDGVGGISCNVLHDEGVETQITVDATNNILYPTNGVSVDLPKGSYKVRIQYTSAKINDHYHAPMRVAVSRGMSKIVSEFVDKGKYDNANEACLAYRDSAIVINHDGGSMKFFVPVEYDTTRSGSIILGITPLKIEVDLNAVCDPQICGNHVSLKNIAPPLQLKDLSRFGVTVFELDGNLLSPAKHK